MTTLVEQPCVSSLDHHGCSQSSNCSQQFAQTFGGGKPISEAAAHEEMSQRGMRSETPSINADMEDVTDSASKKRKSEDECPEDFMTQHSQDDAVYQTSQSPEEGLMNVEEHKALYLKHLREAVKTSSDGSFELESALDPLFEYFSGKLTDRTEQGKIVTALILVILKKQISTVQGLLEWASKCQNTEFAAGMKVESEIEQIIASLPIVFRPAGGIPETPAANARSDVVSETPPSQAPSSPTSFRARNLRQEMSPAIGSTPGLEDKRAASVAVERSPRGASAGEEGFPTEREVERHVEKAEEIQNSVSVLKIKRRRLMQQVEHVRSMEQTRKEADKVVQAATANHQESSAALEEAKEALAAAEAVVLQAMKKEREDKEEAAVAKLRAEQAAAEARHARSLMDNDKKEFEHILVRLRRTVRPDSSSDSQAK